MIQLTGKIVDCVQAQNKDYTTGEITPIVKFTVLSSDGRTSKLYPFKADISTLSAWLKCVDRDVCIHVREWKQGEKNGLCLADKKSLPNILRATPLAAAA